MEEDECIKLRDHLQQYVPHLEKLIVKLKDSKERNHELQLNKLEGLHSMITDREKKLKLDMLKKCEDVILKILHKAHPTIFKQLQPKPEPGPSVNMIKLMCKDPPEERNNISLGETDEFINFQKLKTARAWLSEVAITPASPSPPQDILFCQMFFKNENSESFSNHLTGHTGEYIFICNFCPFKTANFKRLQSHMQSSHNSNVKPSDAIMSTYQAPPNFHIVFGYICAECNFIQTDKTTVEAHVNIYHLGENKKIYKINMSTIVSKPIEVPEEKATAEVAKEISKKSMESEVGQNNEMEKVEMPELVQELQPEPVKEVVKEDPTVFKPNPEYAQETIDLDKQKHEKMKEINKTIILKKKCNFNLLDKIKSRLDDRYVETVAKEIENNDSSNKSVVQEGSDSKKAMSDAKCSMESNVEKPIVNKTSVPISNVIEVEEAYSHLLSVHEADEQTVTIESSESPSEVKYLRMRTGNTLSGNQLDGLNITDSAILTNDESFCKIVNVKSQQREVMEYFHSFPFHIANATKLTPEEEQTLNTPEITPSIAVVKKVLPALTVMNTVAGSGGITTVSSPTTTPIAIPFPSQSSSGTLHGFVTPLMPPVEKSKDLLSLTKSLPSSTASVVAEKTKIVSTASPSIVETKGTTGFIVVQTETEAEGTLNEPLLDMTATLPDKSTAKDVDPLWFKLEACSTITEENIANTSTELTFLDAKLDSMGNFSSFDDETMQEFSEKQGLMGKELLRCGFCRAGFESTFQLRTHISKCVEINRIGVPRRFKCCHCVNKFKSLNSLIDHIQLHGTLRFACYLCEFKHQHQLYVQSHMKTRHSITSVTVMPIDPKKCNYDEDEFVVRPQLKRQNSIYNSSGISLKSSSVTHEENKQTRLSFKPDEIASLPLGPIFTEEIKCSSCIYQTKVRTNLVRHFQFHFVGTEAPVPAIAPVNPVPCLEKNEKMFDKMTNLALSSLTETRIASKVEKKEKSGVSKEEEAQLPVFVPATRRYACGASYCYYLCHEESMLRYHLQALHSDESVYKCTHCLEKLSSEQGVINVDNIIKHLGLHNQQLYKCSNCKFVHNLKHEVERHVFDRHTDKPASVIIVREIECESEGLNFDTTPLSQWDKNKFRHIQGIPLDETNKLSKKSPAKPFNSLNNLNKARDAVASCVTHVTGKDIPALNPKKSKMLKEKKLQLSNNERNNLVEIDDYLTDMTSVNSENKEEYSFKLNIDELVIQKVEERVKSVKLEDENAVTPSMEEIKKMDVSTLRNTKLSGTYGPFGKPFNKQFVCPLCGVFKTEKVQEVVYHLYKKLRYHRFECTNCGLTGTTYNFLQKHSAEKHTNLAEAIHSLPPDSKIEDWVLKVLVVQHRLILDNESSVSSTTLRDEIKNKDPVDNNKSCNLQSAVEEQLKRASVNSSGFNSVEDINSTPDSSSSLDGDSSTSKGKLHQCQHCGYICKAASGMRTHKKCHWVQKLFKCAYCDVEGVTNYDMIQHSKQAHPRMQAVIVATTSTPTIKPTTKKRKYPKNIWESSCSSDEVQAKQLALGTSEDPVEAEGDLNNTFIFICEGYSYYGNKPDLKISKQL